MTYRMQAISMTLSHL